MNTILQNILYKMQIKKEKNTNISERITELIEYLGLTRNSFAVKLGYGRSQTVYDISIGKVAPSYDFFYRLVNTDISERISIEWLITGKGSISKPKPIVEETNTSILNKLVELAQENALLKQELEMLKKAFKKNYPLLNTTNNTAAEP